MYLKTLCKLFYCLLFMSVKNMKLLFSVDNSLCQLVVHIGRIWMLEDDITHHLMLSGSLKHQGWELSQLSSFRPKRILLHVCMNLCEWLTKMEEMEAFHVGNFQDWPETCSINVIACLSTMRVWEYGICFVHCYVFSTETVLTYTNYLINLYQMNIGILQ